MLLNVVKADSSVFTDDYWNNASSIDKLHHLLDVFTLKSRPSVLDYVKPSNLFQESQTVEYTLQNIAGKNGTIDWFVGRWVSDPNIILAKATIKKAEFQCTITYSFNPKNDQVAVANVISNTISDPDFEYFGPYGRYKYLQTNFAENPPKGFLNNILKKD